MAQLGWPKTTFNRIVLGATVVYLGFWLLFLIAPEARAFIHGIPILGATLEALFILYFVMVALWAVFKWWWEG